MQFPRFALAAALLASMSPAQRAADVGLMMDGGVLTVIYGQSCGPFTCQPFVAGPIGGNQPYNVYVWGAPNQPFVLAADLGTSLSCITVPGIANALTLRNAPVTLTIGAVGPANLIGTCNQGRGRYVLRLPAGTPPGIPLQLQALAISSSLAIPAFTVAIATRTG